MSKDLYLQSEERYGTWDELITEACKRLVAEKAGVSPEDLPLIDPTGAKLLPGEPRICQGNGEHPGFECCCDECDYYLACFPEAMPGEE